MTDYSRSNPVLPTISQAMQACGITPPETLIADGKIHRFGRKKKGWYVLHSHVGFSYGSFGVWGEVDCQSWCSKNDNQLSTIDRDAWRKQRSEQAAAYQAELLAKQKKAANKAINLWNKASLNVDPKHAYLVAKGIYPHGAKQLGKALIIPVYSQDKQLSGCQFINPDGFKPYLTGTKKQGSFCCLKPADYQPTNTQAIYIVEGWATGVSVFMAMNSLVFVAFDKGNLKAVAVFLRDKYPQALIVICGDNDADGGGQRAALEAANAVSGLVVIPT